MPETYVSVERRPDGVAVVTIDRPRANALSIELIAQLHAAIRSLADPMPGAIVLWGGPRLFCAGADIAEFTGPEEGGRIVGTLQAALDDLSALPRASIAAITGYALGGGCEVAMACDFRVAGEGARLGQPEILLGIMPGGGATQRMTHLIGPSRAKDVILSGRHVDAAEAASMGLVNRVVADDRVLEESLRWAGELAGGALVAQGLSKRAVDAAPSVTLAEGLRLERDLFVQTFSTEDQKIGVRSFLADGPGKAQFVGR